MDEGRLIALKEQEIDFLKNKLDDINKEKEGVVNRYEQKLSKYFFRLSLGELIS